MRWYVEREEIGGDPDVPPTNRTGLVIVDGESEMVCALYTHMGWGFVRHGDDEANARLIAAAPDLLAVCRSLVQALEGEPSTRLAVALSRLEFARAAIAKAEGRS